MDIMPTQDHVVSTEAISDKDIRDLKQAKKSLTNIHEMTLKTEKKKSESKKLKKKLNEIEQQNQSLNNLIQDKNNEILELKKSVNSLNEVLNSVPIEELRCNSSIASAKLLELSKKNRQLKAELEKTKNRLTRKDQQLQKLEKHLQQQQSKESVKKESSKPLEELQNKLSALQQKLFETRNKNVELQSQLKLAQKCLQQEIGENFNLNLLANQSSSTNWRGRAQQILHLQQKLKEFQERLENQSKSNDSHLEFVNPTLCTSVSFGSIERPSVRKTEIQHRAKVESLEKEITDLKAEMEELRSKILALKVRNKTLNDEISQYKMKSSTLQEQTDFNIINVATMNERLNQQKLFYDKRLQEMSKERDNILKDKKEMDLNREYLQEKIKEFESCINKKDESIEELNLLVKKLEQDLKAICGGFLFSCREFRKEDFITILDSLESEKNSLLDHNKTLNDRVTQERNKNDNLMDQITKQKIRISRLEAKVRDLERDLEIQNEKKKRTQRIAEYSANLSCMGSNSSLSSFTFENSNLTATTNKVITDPPADSDLNDLNNRLELASEKMALLKEKLDYITAEKDNDIKTFQEIIMNSKNILVETILQHRHSNTSVEDQ
ncbi:coiled-coil domain-containing protein 13 [Lucilia sericata]|uniref:coiled-coil domain-containing protein 13 n=1 Tax=Lucilia sericata TaxID=13632 RepID=UPI0018A84FB4|nr:coiled-coil domain-containing protein 13 [Lucilia sericata]